MRFEWKKGEWGRLSRLLGTRKMSWLLKFGSIVTCRDVLKCGVRMCGTKVLLLSGLVGVLSSGDSVGTVWVSGRRTWVWPCLF